jgi:hypothetical protein
MSSKAKALIAVVGVLLIIKDLIDKLKLAIYVYIVRQNSYKT